MKATIGSVSHGTMRNQDLIPVFLEVLSEVNPAAYQQMQMPGAGFSAVPSYAMDDDDSEWWQSEDAEYIINEVLLDALNEVAPSYCYFGSHEGDGSDYGYWISWDSIEEAVYDKCIIKVDGLEDIPDDYMGEVLEVNDHGNATLYNRDHKGTLTEMWSVV